MIPELRMMPEKIKGVFYVCGRYCGSSDVLPIHFFPSHCMEHGSSIESYVILKDGKKLKVTISGGK